MKWWLGVLMAMPLWAVGDEALVLLAYESGLRPIPERFEVLLHDLNISKEDLSAGKVALGEQLFFDPNLSQNRDISCATCHRFEKGGADGLPTAIGHKGRANPFHLNTPTVLNTAFSKTLFWDGRSHSLEDQAMGPLQASFEMAITPELAVERVRANPQYVQTFRDVYGSDAFHFETIADAIAAYERTLLTRGGFDDFLLGYADALSTQAKAGLELFITKGCAGCHNGYGLGGQTLRKFPLTYHKIWGMATPDAVHRLQQQYETLLQSKSVPTFQEASERRDYLDGALGVKGTTQLLEGFFGAIRETERLEVATSKGCARCHHSHALTVRQDVEHLPLENVGGFTGAGARPGYFRVPLLRNVVQTAPYFHNGSVATLEEAVRLMGWHQLRTRLGDDEVERIVTFLKAVDGERVEMLTP